ncbi:hypothetical protein BC829DRAFT_380715 [Chytridium lagenaria]|nr:hypothetical protein BC829DRAFT_380715 [Chytridium lagenaria]
MAQRAFALAFNAMLPYDGVIQQYSVDDKGQSLLIVFGLPPWGHENNSLYALKASVALSTNMKKDGIGPFTISVATGDLLFSILGNNLRSEAGLLGDVVNISARLMSLACTSEMSILCDNETKVATADIFNYLEFGRQVVKGKTEPIQVWAALSSKASRLPTDPTRAAIKGEKPFFGYTNETHNFVEAVSRWKDKGEQVLVIIEAPTGMGKSTFLEQIMKDNEKIRFCSGNEIDRFTPFYCLQGVMRTLYTIFINELLPSYVETGNSLLRPKTQRSTSTASTGIVETILSSQRSAMKKKKVGPRDSISIDLDYGDSGELYKFLSYFGENTDLCPVLHDVMPWIKVEENTVTLSLGAQARTTILHEILVKVIAAMAEKFDIAITFDNAQFMDNTSMDIAMALMKVCPRLMIIFSTRPLSQYKSKGIDLITKSYNPLVLKLSGLSLKETEDFLIWKFRDWGVIRIASILTEAIQTRSSGSPLFIEQLADSIYFRSPPVVKCNADGLLEPVSKAVNLDQILVRNVETAVLVSFDRLLPAFQELLRVASVFGQHFNLKHIVSVMESDLTVDEVAESIKEYDSFHFLKPTTDDSNDQAEKNLWSITFVTAIYESLPFAQRQEIHFKIASYFESILTDENRSSILPNLTFHYMRTSIRDKNYYFMEQLAMYYVRHKLFTEASVSLERLIKFYESDSQANQDSSLTTVRQASWLSLLGYSLVTLEKRGHESRVVSLKALSLMGVTFPKAKEDFKRELNKNYWRLTWNRIQTFGGLLKLGKNTTREEKMRLEVIFRSLGVLRTVATIHPSEAIEDIPIVTLLYVNFAFENSMEFPVEMVKSCVRTSQLLWFSGKRNSSVSFLNYALRLLPQVESSMNLDLLPASHVLCYRGQIQMAKDFLKRCSKFAEISADRLTYTQAEFFYIQIIFLEGHVRDVLDICHKVIQVCDMINDHRVKCLISSTLLFTFAIMDSHESSDEILKYYLNHVNTMDPLTQRVSSGLCALLYFRQGMVTQSLQSIIDTVQAGEKMPLNQISAVTAIAGTCMLPFIVFSEKQYKSDSNVAKMLSFATKAYLTCIKRFSTYYTFAEAVLPLIACADNLVKGMNPDQALTILEKARRKSKQKKLIESMGLIDAVYSAVMARFTEQVSRKNCYLPLAKGAFVKMGCNGLARWTDGESYLLPT